MQDNKRRLARVMAVAILIVALSIVACGVRYSDPEPGTEFFENIDITGDMEAGETLTVTVGITQTNPVEVVSVCELRQDKKTLFEIGRDTIAALPEGNPGATPVVSEHSHDFTVDEAGTYVVECLTPKDEDNFIAKEIKVS